MKNFVKLLLLCTIICLGTAFGININAVNAQTNVSDCAITYTTPPEKYDLRDKIYINVEHQRNFGICYAFASLTSLETYIALNYNEYYDFSEIHFASSLYLKDNYYSSVDAALRNGGNFNHFVLYTQKDNSLVLDQAMPMSKYTNLSRTDLEQTITTDYNNIASNFFSIVKVNDTTSFDVIWGDKSKYSSAELTNFRTKVKNHILQYGSISASIYSSGTPEFTGSSTYYRVIDDSLESVQDVRKKVNHMISVVGWDDNYDANGAWSTKGAYLCLNSWGTTFGDDGYFYISYDDSFIESSMHGVTNATLCTSPDKISTISLYQDKTNIYSHVYSSLPTRYFANIIDVSSYLNQTITTIDSFIIGSNYSVYYKSFSSYNDALSGINSPTTNVDVLSYDPGSIYNKLHLAQGITIDNNYLLIVTRIDSISEVNSIGTSPLTGLDIIPTYSQNKGLNKFDLSDNKWDPDVPNEPIDLTVPIILHLDSNTIEVLPIESTSQSVIHSRYIQNNAAHINKTITIKLNNAILTQDIINAIKIVSVNGDVDITSNFQISLNAGNIDITLTNINSLNFDNTDYLISIPCSNTTIYRVINIQDIGESYNISYNLDGGLATNPNTYTSKHSTLILNSPTKDGYEFIGWYLDSDLTIPFNHNNLPYTDLILYAKYQILAPTITEKTRDIETIYNNKDLILSLSATHPLADSNNIIKYQWYYAKTASSTFEPIVNAVNSSISVKNIADSGYYACNISLVDASNNVLSYISYSDEQTLIKVKISKAELNINVNDVISNTDLSNEELIDRFSCNIDCQYLPENVTEHHDILNYLQLQYTLTDTTNPNIKTISVMIKDFDFYDVYINPGQYRIVINQLNSNDIYTTSEKGFTKDCVFDVADYGVSESINQLLNNRHLNFISSYDLSYSYLDSTATVYIPLDSRYLLTNIAVYMYKDNQLIRLNTYKFYNGISFSTTEADAKYIIVQEKPNKLSNIDFLILVIVVVILGTFTVYIVITKYHH